MNQEDLDNALMCVIKVLNLGLVWEKTESKIRNIISEIKGQEQKTIFDLIQQNAQKYPLLVGFCYRLGIGTVNNDQQAFEQWNKDTTTYGHFLVGRCYFYGWGVDIDYDEAVFQYILSAESGSNSGQ